jgi:hypothetical protein
VSRRSARVRTVGRDIVIAVSVAVAAATASAAEPSIEVQLDQRKIGIEDATLLVVRILEPSGTPEIDLGALTNFEVVSGPSTKTEFSWINGVATRAISFSYVLHGLEVGPAAVGPVTVTLEGAVLRAERLTAEIVPGSVVEQSPSGRHSPFPFDPFDDLIQRRQPARSAQVVLRQLVDVRRLVLGEPLVAVIVLDTTAGGIDGFEWVTPPSFPNWWAQRVEPPERVSAEVVEIDGVRYNRFVVARNVLVPLKTGRLVVPPVAARIGFRSASLFAPQQVVERTTDETAVEIIERPRPPEGYSGAVGDLQYSASLEPEVIDYGESAVLTIELQGNGNLPLVEAPASWPACTDCESYPPEDESRVVVDDTGIHGSRSWRMTLIPRISGPIDLAPVMLAVFDPAAGHYRKQSLGPLRLLVEPPPSSPVPVATTSVSAESNRGAVEERPQPEVREERTAPWMWVAGALLIGLGLGALVPVLARRRSRADLPPRRSGESPAERARELQIALEHWWLGVRNHEKGRALEEEMQQLRRELESIRFAPGRADHTETVLALEERLRGVMRRA